MRHVLLLGLALPLLACSDDEPLTGLEGIYTITTWTENPQACDAEGPSVATSHDPLVYLKAESFFGTDFVNIVSCADQAECESMARDEDTLHLGGFVFENGNDRDGWTSRSVVAFESGGMCNGFVSDDTMTATGQVIRIEERTRDVPAFTGECTDEAVEERAAALPCNELEIITATFSTKF